MRLRPLGWELTLLLVVIGVLLGAMVTGSTTLLTAAVWSAALGFPLAFAGFVVRLVAGIVEEFQRRRQIRFLIAMYEQRR